MFNRNGGPNRAFMPDFSQMNSRGMGMDGGGGERFRQHLGQFRPRPMLPPPMQQQPRPNMFTGGSSTFREGPIPMGQPAQKMYAGGSPTFNESLLTPQKPQGNPGIVPPGMGGSMVPPGQNGMMAQALMKRRQMMPFDPNGGMTVGNPPPTSDFG